MDMEDSKKIREIISEVLSELSDEELALLANPYDKMSDEEILKLNPDEEDEFPEMDLDAFLAAKGDIGDEFEDFGDRDDKLLKKMKMGGGLN